MIYNYKNYFYTLNKIKLDLQYFSTYMQLLLYG